MEESVAVMPVIDRVVPGCEEQPEYGSPRASIIGEQIEIVELKTLDPISIQDVKDKSVILRLLKKSAGSSVETQQDEEILDLQSAVKKIAKNWRRRSYIDGYTERVEKGHSLNGITSEDGFVAFSSGAAPLLTLYGEKYVTSLLKESLDNGDFANAIFARDTLITSNLRFVISIAKKYPRGHGALTFAEYVQEGNKGLERAVDKFNPEKGFKFNTYAAFWIKSFIGRYTKRQPGVISIPDNVSDIIATINKLCNQVNLDLFEDNLHTIAEAIDIPYADVRIAYDASRISQIVSLEKPSSEGDSTLEDIIASTEPNFEEAIDNKQQIVSIFKRLKAAGIEEDITNCLLLKYLSDPKRILSNQEVADILGVQSPTVGNRIKKLIERIDRENLLADTDTFA